MTDMKYASIPGLNKPVARILVGSAGKDFMQPDTAAPILDAAMALGFTTIDTARVYSGSERAIGSWMEARGNREQVVILSKCAHPNVLGMKRVNEAAIRKDFRASCEALHTDSIDIYLLHRDDPGVPVGEVVEIFNAMHAEGKIGVFGASNWTHQRLEMAGEYAYSHGLIPFAVSSPNFGLAEQVHDPWGGGCVAISGPKNAEARQWYHQQNMPIVAYSSLGRGLFSGKLKSTQMDEAKRFLDAAARKGYLCPQNFERLRRCEELARKYGCTVPQIAMAWIFRQKLNTFAVVSTSNPARFSQYLEALNLELSEEEARYLNLETTPPVFIPMRGQ